MGRRVGRSRWDSYLINSSHDEIVRMRALIKELEDENGKLRLELEGAQRDQAERYIKLCEAMDTLREMRNVAVVEL